MMAKELSSESALEGRSRMLLVEGAWWSVGRRVGVAAHLTLSSVVPCSHNVYFLA